MLKASIASPLDSYGYTHTLRIGTPKQIAYLYLEIEDIQGKGVNAERIKTFEFTPSENIYVGDKLILELVIYHRLSLDYDEIRSDLKVEALLKSSIIKLINVIPWKN